MERQREGETEGGPRISSGTDLESLCRSVTPSLCHFHLSNPARRGQDNMATQIYCTKSDIEAVWPAGSLLASVDDDSSGTLSATELSYIDRAIERAANFINARLEQRYRLYDLAANTWCRDANAAIAAYWLSTRKGAAAPAHLQQQYDAYVAALGDIVNGRIKLPEQAESFDVTPGVTNFSLRMDRGYGEAERVDETSV
jgi:phage gp36-like protein